MKGPTALCGKKIGMIISSTNQDLDMKNKPVEISYHKLQ